MSEGLRGALNAMLYRTGDQSRDFVVVLATNRPGGWLGEGGLCWRWCIGEDCGISRSTLWWCWPPTGHGAVGSVHAFGAQVGFC